MVLLEVGLSKSDQVLDWVMELMTRLVILMSIWRLR